MIDKYITVRYIDRPAKRLKALSDPVEIRRTETTANQILYTATALDYLNSGVPVVVRVYMNTYDWANDSKLMDLHMWDSPSAVNPMWIDLLTEDLISLKDRLHQLELDRHK